MWIQYSTASTSSHNTEHTVWGLKEQDIRYRWGKIAEAMTPVLHLAAEIPQPTMESKCA